MEVEVITMIFFLIILTLILPFSAAYHISVNYGTVANNLPPPHQVINFIKTKTNINHIKIFDTNPNIIASFSCLTSISLTVTVPNSNIISLSKLPIARSWLSDNILPFLPITSIRYIAVGNELISFLPWRRLRHHYTLLTSLRSQSRRLTLGILSGSSDPPSSGKFRKLYEKTIFTPILDFHNRTKFPFMVNPYPYFGIRPETLNYALFNSNDFFIDPVTKLNYTNMFDAQLDAVYSAMKWVGYGDVDIVVAETGWPSAGEPFQTGVGLDHAAAYNRNLIEHVNSGKGTPLMPNRVFETHIFSLFNENLNLRFLNRISVCSNWI